MAEVVENTENTENETPAVPQMSTVERAEMLLKQDATIREKIKSGATLDEAVDPSNKEFGPLAHPEQVQMRVAKRAMMLEAGIAPYPVHLDVTDTIEAVRAKYDGKLAKRPKTWSALLAACCSCATRAACASCSCPPVTAPRFRA